MDSPGYSGYTNTKDGKNKERKDTKTKAKSSSGIEDSDKIKERKDTKTKAKSSSSKTIDNDMDPGPVPTRKYRAAKK